MKTAIEILAEKFPGENPEEQLMESLPHGHGIDALWQSRIFKNGSVEVGNSYHAMDENGMYDGWGDFRIVLFVHKKTILRALKGVSAERFQVVQKRGALDWRMHTRFPRRNSFWGVQDGLSDLFANFFYCKDDATGTLGICQQGFPIITSEEAVEMLKKRCS